MDYRELNEARNRTHITPEQFETLIRLYGVNQSEVAKKLNVVHGHISNIINRRSIITNEMNDKIVKEFKVDENVIFVVNAIIKMKREYKEGN